MEDLVAPLVQVRLVWASHHQWSPRQSLQSAPPALALWLVLEGQVEIRNDLKTYEVGAGEMFLCSPASQRHIATADGAAWLSLGLQVNLFDHLELSRALELPVQWRPTPEEWSVLHSCIRQLVNEWHGGEPPLVNALNVGPYTQEMDDFRPKRAPMDVLIAESLARAVFGMCWRRLAGNDALLKGSRLPNWLSQTLQNIHNDPTTGIAALAKEAGFSPAQFRRAFHEHVGVSPRDYVLGRRLDIARGLLEADQLPVSQIAAHCGFSSLSHFIHIFKKTSGLSPSRYRQAARHARV